MDEGAETGITVPISALEHYSYCPRQCALIHVEQTFDDNVFTVRGDLSHARVDTAPASTARGVRILRSIPLWSGRYGLTGKADVVEIHPAGPLPVEYKVGRIVGQHAAVQLCAQALCLEEMFGTSVHTGALFSHAAKRRVTVSFDETLRGRTLEVIEATRRLLEAQLLPGAPNDTRCPNCSLINACLPAVVAESARMRSYQRALFVPLGAGDGGDWFA